MRASFQLTGTYRWPVTAGNAYARWFAAPLFPLHIDHGPDGTLNTVAPVYGDVVTIPRVLGQYRIHGANMWTSDGLDQTRLPYRIEHRRREVAFMRAHAARMGVAVPDGRRARSRAAVSELPPDGAEAGPAITRGARDDTVAASAARGAPRAGRGAPSAQAGAARISPGSTLLAAAPARAAPALIRLRFGRGAWLAPRAAGRLRACAANAPRRRRRERDRERRRSRTARR